MTTGNFEPQIVFESSGTTRVQTSKHYLPSIDIYEKSFTKSFEIFYGYPHDWCIVGLLPSYLERENSSLVKMVDSLIKRSNHALSGFYLNEYDKLHQTLLHNEIRQQPTLLIGVTYALLDFAEKFKMNLAATTVMETGGMKGRKKEITRQEVHEMLKKRLSVKAVHSEYGMTELLSQAYSAGDGLFRCPPWMKILIRDEDDPLQITSSVKNNFPGTGVINVIDLANVYSCAFIATEDLGKLYSNDKFEVLGRCDASEARGCSLLLTE